MRCGDAVARQELGQDVLGKVRLPLVEIAGQQLDRQQPAPLEIEQQRQEPIAVLAARERHQPALARPHHAELLDRLARQPDQALAQLVELDRPRRGAEHFRRGCLVGLDFENFVHGRGS